jgi:hypothetical protein
MTIDIATLATTLDTDPRTARKFMRSITPPTCSREGVALGDREARGRGAAQEVHRLPRRPHPPERGVDNPA